jgi:hypothetical protein
MDPTQNLKQADPLAVLMDVLDAPDVVPGARTDQPMPNPAHDSQPRPTDSQTHAASDGPAASSVPPVDTTFRPTADNVRRPDNRTSFGRRAVRGLIGFLLAVCIGIASFVWQSPYSDEARQWVASWMPESFPTLPQSVLTLFQPRENPGLAAQPTPSADQAVAAATAQPAAPQSAAPAQTAPEAAAPTAALSPESRQLLQSMARDLATVEQGIEQLKASQEQLARDNAKLAEQLKVNQERMTRILAKASEQNQNLRPKLLPARPRLPTARELREPVSTLPPPQAIAPPPPGTTQPQAAVQPQADPELPSVPRPPLPVH